MDGDGTLTANTPSEPPGDDEDLERLPPELVFRAIRSRNLFEETVEHLEASAVLLRSLT